MPQVAVDAKGNKIRWDETKQEWVPVEKAVNGKGMEIEYDGGKWNPVVSGKQKRKQPWELQYGVEAGKYRKTVPEMVEGAVSSISGLGAFPISAATALVNTPFVGPVEAKRRGEYIASKLTYHPQTAGGQEIAQTFGGIFTPLTKAQEVVGKALFPKNEQMRAGFDIGTSAAMALMPFLKPFGKAMVQARLAKGQKITWPEAEALVEQAKETAPPEVIKDVQTKIAEAKSTPPVSKIKAEVPKTAAEKARDVVKTDAQADYQKVLAKQLLDDKAITQAQYDDMIAEAVEMKHRPEPIGDVLGIVPPGFQRPATPSPEVAKVRAVVKKTPSRLSEAAEVVKGVIKKPGKILHKTAFEVVDRYDPFRRWDNYLVEKIREHQKEGGKLSPKAVEIAEKGMPFDESTYNMLQLRGGAGGESQLAYRDLQKFFQRVGDMPQEFTDYMVSLRMIERAHRGISNPGGITAEEALASYNKIVESLSPQRQKDFHVAAQMFTYWSNTNILKRMVDSDMISKEDAVKMMEMNHHPLPFQRFTSKEDLVRFLNDISFENLKDGEKYVNVSGQKIFAMEGMAKEAKIQDPWEAVLERLGAVVGVAERNKAFANFVRKAQLDPATRKMVRRVKPDTKLPPEYGSFNVVLNGKAQRWSAPIDIIESMKTLQARDIGFISGLMGKTKNAFVVGTTGLNLPFGLIKNPIRDLWTVAVTSKYGFGPGAYMSGLVNSLAANFGFPTRLYNDYLRSHAAFGGFLNRAPRIQAKDLFLDKPNLFGAMAAWNKDLPRAMDKAFQVARQVVNPISLFKGVSRSIEMAPRMGQFKKNVQGIRAQSPEFTNQQVMTKAALLARRSTVDFHRAGNFVKTANYFIPFLNARVQSVMNTLEALTSKKGIREGKSSIFGIKGDARAIAAARVAAFIVTPSLAAYFYNRLHHSEDYDRVPQDTKDRYIVIMTGTSSPDPDTGQMKPEAILIPKTDAHQIFWNPTESLLEWAWANKPQDILGVATNFFSNVSPVQFEKEGKPSLSRAIAGVLPPSLQAPLSIATNKDFYWDRPLIPGRLENVAPAEQYTSYTPEAYRNIGAKLGISPIKTQKLAESFVGGVARTPTPATIGKGLKETVLRRVGREFGADIYDIDKQATSGYETARIRAERMAKDGDREGAIKVIREWNAKSAEFAAKMAKASGKQPGYVRRQSWFKQIYFSQEDIMNLLKRVRQKPKSGIKKELNLR